MKLRGIAVVVLGVALLAPVVRAEEKAPWIHIRVTEGKDQTSKVNLNLPLSLVDVALDVIKTDAVKDGRIKVEGTTITVAQMRRIWAELKKTGDADFADIQDGDNTIKVAKKNEKLMVTVREGKAGKKTVYAELQQSVVDALLAGDGDTLDLKGAMAMLQTAQRGELVRVDDQDNNVRVWIE